MTTFHVPKNNDKESDEQIKNLQNEINLLQEKILQLQTTNNDPSQFLNRCQKLTSELERLKCPTVEYKSRAATPQYEPALEYEQLRRKIEHQARELTYFISDQLHKLSEKLSSDDKSTCDNVARQFTDQSRVLLASIRNLTRVDGYQAWREHEHENLSKLIQKRLNYLQSPSKPCTEVKRVSCNIDKDCGYGCQIHHVMHCFHIAYALGRPMILLSEEWRYNRGGFNQIFQPLSDKCTEAMVSPGLPWSEYEAADVANIPIIDDIYPRKEFMPMAIPEDIAQRLIRLHGNPFVWFTAQLLKYLLRPQKWLVDFMEKNYEEMHFTRPVVGIHIRRTDKIGTEAAFHDLSEYMKHVEDYYVIFQYQNPDLNFTKRVYIASDDPAVLNDAKTKYPDYIFYGDPKVAQSAQLETRYSTESLKGVLLDIHFLSLCDYLVCTFSSQVCRVAYEVMQQRIVDSAWRVQPLDDVYYFGGQNPHNQQAVMSHKHSWPKEFSFERGDIIGTQGNHWDGFSKGSDKTNGQSGLYPSYKVEEIVNIAKMYTYPEVEPNNSNTKL